MILPMYILQDDRQNTVYIYAQNWFDVIDEHVDSEGAALEVDIDPDGLVQVFDGLRRYEIREVAAETLL